MGVQLMLRLKWWNPVAFFQIYGCFPNVHCSVSHWKCLQNPVRIKTCCKLLPLQLSLIKFRMELHFSAELTKSNTNLQVRTLLLWCWGLFCFLWYCLGAKEIQTGSMWCTKDTMTGFQGWVLHKHSFNDCLSAVHHNEWCLSFSCD